MITVRVDDTSIPQGVCGIVEQLPQGVEMEAGSNILMAFSDHYVYRTGLVMLAAWRKTLPPGIEVALDTADCMEPAHRLIENCGLRELVESNHVVPSTLFPNRVPVQPLLRGESVEETVGQICNIFAAQDLNDQAISSVKVALSELCENAYAHSGFETPSYVSAGLHGGNRCEIAICDTGIGVLASYMEGTNETAKARIGRGASAVELAVNEVLSSKPTAPPGTLKSYFGYGLFVVRRLIRKTMGD